MQASAAYQTTVDTDTFHPRDDTSADRAEVAEPSRVLPLPAPGPGGRSQLVLGQSVQMDHLGPMVVGEDGTLSRIANWERLTEREREVALRRITCRNRERLARLRGEGSQGEAAPGQGGEAPAAPSEAAQAQQGSN